ncbi:MAG: S-layer homology domain-containing protein, partial [Clostridia bacterium]
FKEWRVSDNVSVADKKNPNLTIIMPASSVDVTAVFEYNPGKRYTVKVFPSRGGTAMSDKRDYLPGDHVILTATPNLGYLFYQWVKRDNITIVNDTARETSFIMPAYDVAINAEFVINPNIGTGGGGGGGGGGNGSGSKPPTFGSIFTVNFDSQGGTPIASATVYSNGTVAQPAAPTRDGHVFGGWYTQAACTDAYNFSSPVAKSFTLFARWMPIAVAEPYTDVTSSDWFYDDVIFLTKEGVVNGINGKLFCPNDNITRAQFAQILAKAADAKLADNTVDFSDIDVTSWYYKPIAWATANGIVNGVREKTFDPNAPISRQDMAVMISRYIKNILKKQLPPKGDMSEFADMAEVSEYAKAAVSEVKNCGIVGGNEKNEFEPLANATRAEACKMIHTLLTIAG